MMTTMVENWPGYRDGIMGPDLISELRAQALRFGAEVVPGRSATWTCRSRPFVLTTSEGTISAHALIVATGASARLLGLPSERALMGHGVSTCATCDGYFYRGRPVAVVGGGDSAVEEAIFLTKFASQGHADPPARQVARVEDHAGQGDGATRRSSSSGTPTSKTCWTRPRARSRRSSCATRRQGDARTLPVDGVFVAIGHIPNTELFRGQLDMDENGYLVTSQGSRTNVPGVFAAGDVQDHVYRQAITAAGSGCMAAIDAERYLERVSSHVAQPAVAHA